MDPTFQFVDPQIAGLKARKVQRACDSCRKKRTRCDGKTRCLNCTSYNLECTYLDGTRKAGPSRAYVQNLENRLKRVETILSKLSLNTDYKKLIDSELQAASPPASASPSSDPDLGPDPELDTDTDDDGDILPALTGPTHLFSTRFFGKSSGMTLVTVAHHLKQDSQQLQNRNQNQPQPQVQTPPLRTPVSLLDSAFRAEYWQTPPWEKQALHLRHTSSYTFPPPSLLRTLTALYFAHTNLVLPLLHRPTFTRAIAEELHLHDPGFGAVVLLVCALGAKHSADPRVLPAKWKLEGEGESGRWRWAGWEWFAQVQDIVTAFLVPPTLYDVQFYCLLTQYLDRGADSIVRQTYAVIGVGVQMAQDMGAHRKKRRGDAGMSVEDELSKRAFWVLFCLDRMASSFLGRPCIIQDEDFDIDLPIECDDEYWELPSPSERFKQPPNKPCSVTPFIIYIKLLQILGSSLKTIYSINITKIIHGGAQWEQRTVAELDSALNKWLDSIPSYLRWDSQRQDAKTFSQAAWLYCMYHYIQIVVHKPFVPHLPAGKSSPLSFSSLAICTKAAKSCIHVAVVHSRRCVTPLQFQLQVFTSANLLLLNTMNGKTADPVADMVEVHQCMELLKRSEARWNLAGRLWDVLYVLESKGDRSSTPADSNSDKWPSDADNNSASTTNWTPKDQVSASNPPLAPPLQDDPHARHTHENAHKPQPCFLENTSQSISMRSSSYALPVYSEKLRHLPAATPGQVVSELPPLGHGHEHAFSHSAFSFQGNMQAQPNTYLHVHDPVHAAAVPMAPTTGSAISRALHPLDNDAGSSLSVYGNEHWSQNYPQVKHYPSSAPTTTVASLADSTGTLTSSNDAENSAEQRTPMVMPVLTAPKALTILRFLNEWGSFESVDNLTYER